MRARSSVSPSLSVTSVILARVKSQFLQPMGQPSQTRSASISPHQPRRSVLSGSGKTSSGPTNASVPSATRTAVASSSVSSSVPSLLRTKSMNTPAGSNVCLRRTSVGIRRPAAIHVALDYILLHRLLQTAIEVVHHRIVGKAGAGARIGNGRHLRGQSSNVFQRVYESHLDISLKSSLTYLVEFKEAVASWLYCQAISGCHGKLRSAQLRIEQDFARPSRCAHLPDHGVFDVRNVAAESAPHRGCTVKAHLTCRGSLAPRHPGDGLAGCHVAEAASHFP